MRIINLSILFLAFSMFTVAQTGEELYQKASKSQKSEDYNNAIFFYTQAIEQDSSFLSDNVIYFDLGICKMELGDNRGAIKDFDIAINLNSESNAAFYNRGLCKLHLKDYQEAKKDFSRAIILDSMDKGSYLNRAVCKRKLRDNKAALLDYNKAIKCDPSDGEVYYQRAEFKIYLRD